MFFASDNGSGVAPEVMAALAADRGYARAYGADEATEEVTALVRTEFDAPEAEVVLVASGTAANALALSTLCPPWGVVFCREEAHVAADECNAAEFFSGGAKLETLPGSDGKLRPETLAAALSRYAPGDLHMARPAALSLTNLTEMGSLYRPAEIAALTEVARGRGLGCHLDGARFANALAAAGAAPAEMSWQAGIDILSLGGTKNGLMGVEAVVIFDPARAEELRIRRKRAGHLLSKHRYLALQMRTYLRTGCGCGSRRRPMPRASGWPRAWPPCPRRGFSGPSRPTSCLPSCPSRSCGAPARRGPSSTRWAAPATG